MYRHIAESLMEQFCHADPAEFKLLYSKQAGREAQTAKINYASSNVDVEDTNRIDYMENLSSSRSWQVFIGDQSIHQGPLVSKSIGNHGFDSAAFDQAFKEYFEQFIAMTKQGYLNVYSLVESVRSGIQGTT